MKEIQYHSWGKTVSTVALITTGCLEISVAALFLVESTLWKANQIFMLPQGFNWHNKCYLKSTKPLIGDRLMYICTAAASPRGPGKPSRRKHLPQLSSYLWALGLCILICSFNLSEACSINSTNGVSRIPCLQYRSSQLMFELTCSFHWSSGDHDCIVLKEHEVFEGNGNGINITGNNNWEGLFQIDDSATSLDNAPMIRNIHIIGGETSVQGGFVIQSEQKHFIVDSCSSTGKIRGILGGPIHYGGGGICGNRCSGDIQISNCSSSGEIGFSGGGITGRELGIHGNASTVNVTHCHSTGDIVGLASGGICGHRAGDQGGRVLITYSYSTGKIIGNKSGGICGSRAGKTNGEVVIEQCYSLGEIAGQSSGGITGQFTADSNGHVSIANSYSRGHITGTDHAGGICGAGTGTTCCGHGGGTVIVTNVYASGDIEHGEAGGLIGEILSFAKSVHISMSVYNGNSSTSAMVGGNIKADTSEQTSGNLNDIVKKLYCYEAGDCWNSDTIWTVISAEEFPVLQFPGYPPTSGLNSEGRPTRRPIIPCLHYKASNLTFSVSCSFNWTDFFYESEYIGLYKDEVFDGNGYQIGLYGIGDWEGLVRIDDGPSGNAPSSLHNAPVIQNLHVIGGETSVKGGFVIQSAQRHFIVDSCSSTGIIRGLAQSSGFGGGGICGQKCSGDILIKNCWSTGLIHGHSAGGITGREIGLGGNLNTVNITHCYSTGDIFGVGSGGICGNRAGRDNGHVSITKSYSTGNIKGAVSGGICGEIAGNNNGEVVIEQCYSVGEISGRRSGGITGSVTAERNGYTSITNCYSRGTITGSDSAGGICESDTGRNNGTVTLTNVYSSGVIQHNDAGGLIGEIESDANRISVIMSVYNGKTGVMVGGDKNPDNDEKNSANLNDIRGTIYCYNVDQPDAKKCWDNQTIWQRVKDDFPMLRDIPTPIPPTPSPSPKPSQRPRRILIRFPQLPVQRPCPRVIDRR